MSRVLMEPVQGLSEKEKREAIEEGHRLQRMVARLFHEQRTTPARGIGVCLNIAIATGFAVGLSREHVLEMVGRQYDEIAGKAGRG